MVQIVEFTRESFLSQPTAADGSPIALIQHGKGSRYELIDDMTTAGVPAGFVKIKIRPAPQGKTTWFAQVETVQELTVDKAAPTRPVESTLRIIEFTNPGGSFLKQSSTILSPKPDDPNVILQGEGARCEVYFTGAEENGHREMRIPIKPGGKETWWVFGDHIKTI